MQVESTDITHKMPWLKYNYCYFIYLFILQAKHTMVQKFGVSKIFVFKKKEKKKVFTKNAF